MKVEAIRAFSDNYIWCLSGSNPTDPKGAVVVDPGDATPVLEHLKAEGLELTDIIITHHHGDHTGGVATLKSQTGARVYGPKGSPKSALYDIQLGQEDSISVAGLSYKIFATPGHTLDHIVYFSEQSELGPILFCGDTLFAAGCGRLFEGTPKQMVASLSQLRALPKETKAFPTHEYTLANLRFAGAVEPKNSALHAFTSDCQKLREEDRETLPVTIGGELSYNPFLRWDQDAVQQAAYARAGSSNLSHTEVFAEIRAWKDSF